MYLKMVLLTFFHQNLSFFPLFNISLNDIITHQLFNSKMEKISLSLIFPISISNSSANQSKYSSKIHSNSSIYTAITLSLSHPNFSLRHQQPTRLSACFYSLPPVIHFSTQQLVMFLASLTSSPQTFHLFHYIIRVMLVSFLFLQQAETSHASKPLPLLFPLPGMFFPQIFVFFSSKFKQPLFKGIFTILSKFISSLTLLILHSLERILAL